MCDVASFLEENINQIGHYCMHPKLEKPRLIIEKPKYQMGIRSPRWCPKKSNNNITFPNTTDKN